MAFGIKNLKHHPQIFLISCVLIATLAFLILRPGPKPVKFKSRIAIPGFQSSALVILAHEQGYFKDEGVEVTLEYKALGRDCLALVVAGKADLAVVFETPVVRSLLEGNKISVLTELHRSEFNAAIVARKDRGIANAHDLIGKTVAIVAKTNAEFHLDLLLRSHLIDPATLKIKQMAVDEVLEALLSGHVDAASLWEPFVSQAVHKKPEKLLQFRSSFYSEFSMLAGMHANLQAKREESLAILRALIRAQDYFDKKNGEARSTVERILKQQNFFVSPLSWDQMDVKLGLSATLLTMFSVEADWYRAQDKLSGPKQLDNIFIGSYLKSLAPDLVTYE